MPSRYSVPMVESVLEHSDDEKMVEGKLQDEQQQKVVSRHHNRLSDSTTKASSSRGREKPRRHKIGNASKHSKKAKAAPRKADGTSTRERVSKGHRQRLSDRNDGSDDSSSGEEEDSAPDHRAILAAAKARLTSPSTVSALTAHTTATNKSSSSSGSNSTVTQLSITKNASSEKRQVKNDAPLSPAVPDPPDVFAFLEQDSPCDIHLEQDIGILGDPKWSSEPNNVANATSTSSASSSFQGDDNFSESAVDNDTDRSSSPDRSIDGDRETQDSSQPLAPSQSVSAKIASQMAAAHHRQNHYAMQQFGTPEMPRGLSNLPHLPSIGLTTRNQNPTKQVLPRAEKLPVTGYELLASRLASSSEIGETNRSRIKPMYRKFEALNHRLLLYLQDELSELEEQLHRLDNADTQSRRTDRHIIPASRRAAAQAGGELQWHKTDILGRIGYKLNQYNAALASFNSTQSLNRPTTEDIESYRTYLHSAHPITESETHFLDPAHDLVSLCSDFEPTLSQSGSSQTASSYTTSLSASTRSSTMELEKPESSSYHSTSYMPPTAMAIAVAILVPILTFNVIPGFIGRMTVSFLVAIFMLFALLQSKTIQQNDPFGQEGMICMGIYTGVMTVIAGIMA